MQRVALNAPCRKTETDTVVKNLQLSNEDVLLLKRQPLDACSQWTLLWLSVKGMHLKCSVTKLKARKS